MTTPASRAGARIEAFFPWITGAALLAMIVYACFANHFALYDDAISLMARTVSPQTLFAFTGPGRMGRYFPMYGVMNWALFNVLPAQAWALALMNGTLLAGGFCLAADAARRLGGALPASLAVWFALFNLSTTENLFTLSKAEPKQLPFLMLVVWILIRALGEVRDRLTAWEPAMLLAAASVAVLIKESAVLLLAGLGVLALHSILERRRLARPELLRRAVLIVCGVMPLGLTLVRAAFFSLSEQSYLTKNLLASGRTAAFPSFPGLSKDYALTLLHAAGIIAGGALARRAQQRVRWQFLFLTGQLAVAWLAFGVMPGCQVYYLQFSSVLAAILVACAVGAAAHRASRVSVVTVLAAALFFWNANHALGGAAALDGWSWGQRQLVLAGLAEKPKRVYFYHSGGFEMHGEAWLYWHVLNGLPVEVGVLDGEPAPEPVITSVQFADLRPGDWVLQELRYEDSYRPIRGLGGASGGRPPLSEDPFGERPALRRIRVIKSSFPRLRQGLVSPRREAWIEWSIYEVVGAPGAAATPPRTR